jgi:hypothetical protein
MSMFRLRTYLAGFALLALLAGCTSTKGLGPYETAFRQYHPRSIVVLPPLNNTNDVRATYSLLSSATAPLAESGYYVFPVAIVDQTFKENGLTLPAEMHQASPVKLNEIFGADAALYLTITQYGANSVLLGGDVAVKIEGVLVDTRTGTKLWEGQASASDAEGKQNQNNNLLGLLITGIINNVANTLSDPGYRVGRVANTRLLSASNHGLLYGPRSPKYDTTRP